MHDVDSASGRLGTIKRGVVLKMARRKHPGEAALIFIVSVLKFELATCGFPAALPFPFPFWLDTC